MYLTKEQIETRILETFDKIVFYNGRRLDEVLPVEERLLLVTSIMENLPPSIPDVIDKYHKDRNLKEITPLKKIYYHLLEEVIELGVELGISAIDIYLGFSTRFQKIQNIIDKEPITKENLLKELADVTTIVASISDFVGMRDLLFDAVLDVRDSNDTKLCTLEEIEQTIKEKNLPVDTTRTHSLGNNKFIIIDESTGKTIKPIGYKKPDLSHLFKNKD